MPHLIYWESPESPSGLSDALERIAMSDLVDAHQYVVLPAHLTVAEACLRINRALDKAPVVFAAVGSRCLDLPAIARAQAAAHRPIVGYSMIRPIFPTSTDLWPEAPVTVYLPRDEDPDRSVSLRGFRIAHFSNAENLAQLILDQSITAQ
jgi:hypothetical protein